MEQVQAETRAILERAYARGLDGQEVLDTILQTVVDLALEEGDDIVPRFLGGS